MQLFSFLAGAGGDAAESGAAAGPAATILTGRGASRGKRTVTADIFVTKPTHIKDKKGKQ